MYESKPAMTRRQHRDEILKETLAIVDRSLFYYHNDPVSGRNIFTTCLFVDKNKNLLSRGVAVCSDMDSHIKKEGRIKAYGRAVKALVNRRDGEEINAGYDRTCCSSTNLYPLIETRILFSHKAMYMPTPTDHELKLINKCLKGNV